jgi:hypothetical protein
MVITTVLHNVYVVNIWELLNIKKLSKLKGLRSLPTAIK